MPFAAWGIRCQNDAGLTKLMQVCDTLYIVNSSTQYVEPQLFLESSYSVSLLQHVDRDRIIKNCLFATQIAHVIKLTDALSQYMGTVNVLWSLL